jgi:hypothetical protein
MAHDIARAGQVPRKRMSFVLKKSLQQYLALIFGV